MRAERSGYKAIVLTVDTPRLGKREADIKNKYPPNYLPNYYMSTSSSHLFNEFIMICCCRMISPPLKNFEGLLSTEASSVSDCILYFVGSSACLEPSYLLFVKNRIQEDRICRHLLIVQWTPPSVGRY